MKLRRYPTAPFAVLLACGLLLLISCFLPPALPAKAQDDVSDLLQNATPAATAPVAVTSPNAPENQPHSDALGTLKPKPPAGARIGLITLSNGIKLEGRIWTTLDTPFRVFIGNGVEGSNSAGTYHDIDLVLVKRIDVHVLAQTMEDDWRWLKEGSDQKIYSGKKFPNVDLAYKFTLINDQTIEGSVVAPIYFADAGTSRTLALYKKYKGKLDETMKDVVYITTITLNPSSGNTALNDRRTTHLPLLDD